MCVKIHFQSSLEGRAGAGTHTRIPYFPTSARHAAECGDPAPSQKVQLKVKAEEADMQKMWKWMEFVIFIRISGWLKRLNMVERPNFLFKSDWTMTFLNEFYVGWVLHVTASRTQTSYSGQPTQKVPELAWKAMDQAPRVYAPSWMQRPMEAVRYMPQVAPAAAAVAPAPVPAPLPVTQLPLQMPQGAPKRKGSDMTIKEMKAAWLQKSRITISGEHQQHVYLSLSHLLLTLFRAAIVLRCS